MGAEAYQYYQDALKQGQKEYKSFVHKGLWPYIQPLPQIQENYSRLSRVGLGLLEIPLYLIAGSEEEQRCNCFSPGFYPLMDADSEFAHKWTTLCAHQMAEGISDPIRCYEYLGRFYVIEGNKRVSVLKFLGGTSIWANVTRLLPEDTGYPAIKLYQEFLEFYRCSHAYGVHFSEPGSYARLQAALGFAKGEVWPEDFQKKFLNCYLSFRSCYRRLARDEPEVPTGDALLRWLKFYTVDEFLSRDERVYQKSLSAIWNELFPDPKSAVDVSVHPSKEAEKKKEGAVSSLVGLLTKPKKFKVAFLFQKNPEESLWTAGHDEGRIYMEKVLGDSVSVLTYYNVPTGDGAEAFIEAAAEEGAELIFTTSVQLLPASLRAAVKYPRVRFMNCSIDQPYVNVAAYYSRIYEGKFVTGAIAGALCRSGRIGYVGSYPILGVPASINAFALGASLVNPDARIELKWHCLPGDYMTAFQEEGIELVSNRDSSSVEAITGPKGLFRFSSQGAAVPLASPVWKWGEFYVRITRGVMNGMSRPERPVSYWWGMSAGTVDVLLAGGLPNGVKALADILRDGLRNGTIHPFHRHITAQGGAVINDGSRDLSLEEILKMDWLCDRVDGSIPEYDELLPVAKPTVRMLGVFRDRIPPEEGTL